LTASSNFEFVETFKNKCKNLSHEIVLRHCSLQNTVTQETISDSDPGRVFIYPGSSGKLLSAAKRCALSLSTPSARGRRLAVANMADIFEPPLKPAIFGGDGSFDPADFFTCTFGGGCPPPRRCKCQKAASDLWTCNFVTQSCKNKNREAKIVLDRYCPGFYLQLCSHKAPELKTRE
jgi:hypothetical protein